MGTRQGEAEAAGGLTPCLRGPLLWPVTSCHLPPQPHGHRSVLPELPVCQEKLGIWRFLGILSTNSVF